MVMVRVSGVLLGIVMLMLSGCVVSHGPPLASTLDVDLDITVRYINGKVGRSTLKPGPALHIGTADWENDPYTPIPIEELVIKEAGQLLHQFNAEDVRLLIEKQDSESGWWCIDRERVNLVLTSYGYRYHDPDARNGCSKGKRLWTWQNGRFYKGDGQSP